MEANEVMNNVDNVETTVETVAEVITDAADQKSFPLNRVIGGTVIAAALGAIAVIGMKVVCPKIADKFGKKKDGTDQKTASYAEVDSDDVVVMDLKDIAEEASKNQEEE